MLSIQRLLLAFTLLLPLARDARADTVASLMDQVRQARSAGKSDAAIAALILRLNLTERLDDSSVEQSEKEGAGHESQDALERQRDLTVELKSSASIAAAEPSDAEQATIIRDAREKALRYSNGLPDFLCTETTRRYSGRDAVTLKLSDTLEVSVGYTAKGDEYKLRTINGLPTKKTYSQVGGFRTSGEFGSLLRSIFRPQALAEFHWQWRTSVRGHPAEVFAFRIAQEHSIYTMGWSTFLKHYNQVFAVRGFVFIDAQTRQVLRIVEDADGVPPDWPVRQMRGTLDYGYATVGGREFLLPGRVGTYVVLKSAIRQNISVFTAYKKFSGDATITFDPAPQP